MSETQTYTVPVIDPATGQGWDAEIEAESPQDAVDQIDDNLHVARQFAEEHFDVEIDDD